MAKDIGISDSEWQVMKVLWKNPNITLKEIAEQTIQCGWGYTTVRTLVNRLVDKGIIVADKTISNNFKYSPVVEEEDCKVKEVKSLLDKVFNGSAGMLVSTLVKDSGLSEREQEDLKAIIAKLDDESIS